MRNMREMRDERNGPLTLTPVVAKRPELTHHQLYLRHLAELRADDERRFQE